MIYRYRAKKIASFFFFLVLSGFPTLAVGGIPSFCRAVLAQIPFFNRQLTPSKIEEYEFIQPLGQGGLSEVHWVKTSEGEFALKLAKNDPSSIKALEQDFKVYKKRFPKEGVAFLKYEENGKTRYALQIPLFREVKGPRKGKPSISLADKAIEVNNSLDLSTSNAFAFLSKDLEPNNAQLQQKALKSAYSLIDQYIDLHQKLILHGDIKPANVLVRENERGELEFYIIDHGLSSVKKTPESEWALAFNGTYGTPRYSDYETMSGQRATARRDAYALSLTLSEVLGHRLNEAQKLILQGRFARSPAHLKELLQVAEGKTPAQVYKKLANEWVKEVQDFDLARARATSSAERAYYSGHADFLITSLIASGSNTAPLLKELKVLSPEIFNRVYSQAENIKSELNSYRTSVINYNNRRIRQTLAEDSNPVPEGPPMDYEKNGDPYQVIKQVRAWEARYEAWKRGSSLATPHFLGSEWTVFSKDFPPSRDSIEALEKFIQAKP